MRRSLVRPCRRDGPAANSRRRPMAAIGFVNGTIKEGFVGQLQNLKIRAAIEIRNNSSKRVDDQPESRGYLQSDDTEAVWGTTSYAFGHPYTYHNDDAHVYGSPHTYPTHD